MESIRYAWRGTFSNEEVNSLHAEAFETRVYSSSEWDWRAQVTDHSLGWVVARGGSHELAGFVNVIWDGSVHAWLQDTMVAQAFRRLGVGRRLVAAAEQGARDAGCEWLHVDFDDGLQDFYLGACGFAPASAGLKRLA